MQPDPPNNLIPPTTLQVSFAMHGPRPGRPIATSMAPTRCTISWTPVEKDMEEAFGEVVEYVVKVQPDLAVQETSTKLQRDAYSVANRWNCLKGQPEGVCVFNIEKLTPGLPYKFEVMPRHKVKTLTDQGGGRSTSCRFWLDEPQILVGRIPSLG